MKKFFTMMIMALAVAVAMAQSPEKFTYQAVVRNASNALVSNTLVGVRVSILQGSATGNGVYVETQMPSTNANGLITLNIGDGDVVSGNFADIDWADGPFFLKTEIDPNGGADYSVTSTQQLLSVPYALFAKEAGNVPASVGELANDANYITLEDVPEIPSYVSAFANDAGYITMDSIPAIPTVPTNVSAFTNDAGYITSYTETDPNVPAWAKEATKPAYDYSEIANTPTIPTVPTNVSSFTNDAGYITVDSIPAIPTVPTNVSAFTNDAGYITSYTETDPNVPAWAKEATKPAYDYSEIANTPTIPTVPTNVSAFTNDAGYITMDSIPAIPTVPTNVSAFTNDAGYITSYTETDPNVPAWAKEATKPAYDYSEIANTPVIPTIPTNVSAFTNDAGYITMDSIPAIPTVPTYVSSFTNDAGYITMDSVPAIPTVPTNVSAFSNDAGYITESDIPALQTIPTNVSQLNNDAGYITMNAIPTGLAGSNTGDIMYWDAATGKWIMMPAGSSGQVLTMENGVPVWANLPDHITMNLPPTVTTSAPSEVTQSSALCGGEVTNDGSVQLTACGVCWSTHHFPTIADAHTENDLSVSAFTSHVTGLAHHTTYYVRAYATNSIGTTYGAEMFFTTADIPSGSVTMPAPCSSDTNTTWHPTLTNGSTLCAGTDSVELTLNNYQYGSIQWQYSTDTVSWFDIPGAIDTFLVYKPEQTQFVRASVSTANCPPEYSPVKLLLKTPAANAGISRTANIGDTVRLQSNMEEGATGSWQILQGTGGFLSNPNEAYTKFYGTDSLYRLRWTLTNSCGASSDDISVRYVQTVVSSKVVMVDTTDIIFSDSAQMANGYYVISFSDPNIVIGDSTILVSLINGGFMRMVDSWSMANDSTYAMYTSQATLYDILESGVIQFDAISGGNEADSVEHDAPPAKEVVYLDHIPTREELRSNPEMTKSSKIYVYRMDMEREDGSRVSLMPGASRSKASDKAELMELKTGENAEYDFDPDLKYKLENVNFHLLNVCPIIEYDKEMRRFRFGIYGATLHLNADFVPKLSIGHFEVTPAEFILCKSPEVAFGVPVGPVVIPFTFDLGITAEFKGSVDISTEARYRLTAEGSLTYGVNIWGKNHDFTIDKGYDGKCDLDLIGDVNNVASVALEASFAGYVNVKLAGVVGPRVKAGYKAKIKYCTSLDVGEKQGWQGKITSDLFAKLDLKAIKMVDKIIPENWSKEITLPIPPLSKPHVFPDSMFLYNGNNNMCTPLGVPVKVKVVGSGGRSIRNVPVYFEAKDGGPVTNHVVFTNESGIAQTIWEPAPSCAVHQLYAYVYDCEKNPIKGAPVVFTAYEFTGCSNSDLDLRYILTGNTLTLQASKGVPPYTYSIDGEHFVPLSELPTLSALACYVFSVMDSHGCIRSISYGGTATPDCDVSDLNIDAELNSGVLTLYATGGTPPYLYSLAGTSYTRAYSDNNEFSSLSPGDYTAYVQDITGCEYSKTITIEEDGLMDLTPYYTEPCAAGSTVTDYDGNVYQTIQIGQQCWMAENLRTTHYADGEIIPIGAACYYPNGNAGNRSQYGLLYTWYAATRNVSSNSNPSGVRGACPYGWHVPSYAEWDQLLNQPQLMACPAKALATKFGWNISTTPCSPGYENWYNNGSGFNAAPAGHYNSGYGHFGASAWFWSTSDASGDSGWYRGLSFNGSGVGGVDYYYNFSLYNKSLGYSVRCLRD
ncbi:MAG: fibrobacter succinogenes major paralogous domain-containing protein [Bacteroidales bacterium]|nr:fibrobacter succinogenes major paralogous domain-containing protein [Bacteroidales bacterium]